MTATFIIAALGAKAFFLLYLWLASAIASAELARRKGYPERVGLGTGLLLSVIGVVIWLAMPVQPESQWARRRAKRKAPAAG